MLVWGVCGLTGVVLGQGTVTVEYKNENLQPSHWILVVHQDGSGQFDSDAGDGPGPAGAVVHTNAVHRELQLTPEFTSRLFQVARERKWFNIQCDSRMKVAFQGWKKFSYSGPEGNGSCEFNYSKDATIEELGSSVIGVASTIDVGERLKRLQQHDRLGLDKEMGDMVEAYHQGQLKELGVIRDVLTGIVADEQVLERVRRKAKLMLDAAH
jgi:hypothetical protein